MKKSVQIIYTILFVLLIALPVLFYNLIGKSLVDNTNYENRRMAEFPRIEDYETFKAFPASFDSYFNDALPFRNQLLGLNGRLEYFVFKSNNESVIIGKDGWLFYKGSQVNEEDPIADYQGTNLFTEEELAQIAAHLQAAKDDCTARGREFLFLIGPNKERIYRQYMPDIYGGGTNYGRIEQLEEYLAEHTDVTLVSPRATLTSYMVEHPEDQLYYKYDTHWNNLGAYLGGSLVNAALGHEMMPLQDVPRFVGNTPPYDLAKLIHLIDVLDDDPAYVLHSYTNVILNSERSDDNTEFRYTHPEQNADPRKVFIVGDSFSTMMAPFVACNFNELYENFYYNYDEEMLERENPDIVIYEVCERYLNNAKSFALR